VEPSSPGGSGCNCLAAQLELVAEKKAKVCRIDRVVLFWIGKSYEADDVSQNAQLTEFYRSRGKPSDLDNVAIIKSPIIRIRNERSFVLIEFF
jgi:hypothetical protein